MFIRFSNLFSPDDSVGKGEESIPASTSNTQDVINFLKEDDDTEDEVIPLDEKKKTEELEEETEEKEEEESKEEDELAELEEELEEPDEEKLELTSPVPRREILAKYPKLFKDFPYLEKAYYREQQYTELLPTIDDAKVAVEKAQVLDLFEKDLVNGDTEKMLIAAKQDSPEGFARLVDNYLPVLQKIDNNAYTHVIGNVVKHTIVAMVQEARAQENDALRNAALLLNQFVFGKSTFEPPAHFAKNAPKNEKEDELIQERQQFEQQKLNSTIEEVDTRINKAVRLTINANIDPKQSMTDYVRRNASREAFETVSELIDKDARFKTLVDKLWDNAKKNGYSKDSVDKIQSAFFVKAKTLLPSVIKKARNDALRGMGKRVSDKSETTTEKQSKNESSRSNTKSDQKKVPEKMSTLEYLMADD